MNRKITDNYFNQASGKSSPSSLASPEGVQDALETFLLSPSFNTKQIALESFWRHLTIGDGNILSTSDN